MRLNADGTLRLSPSDLANYLACAHLTQLESASSEAHSCGRSGPTHMRSSSISRVEPSDISEEEGDCAGREGRHARMMRECGRCYKA
jgi:hypothetical protein